ncbi:hypothetical protein TURU_159443 [Turdus rufiventris]|nr:hypothetical protein TURU_159443 [Turdus rufiventris]
MILEQFVLLSRLLFTHESSRDSLAEIEDQPGKELNSQEQWLNLYFAVALDRVADMVLCEDGSKGVPCPNKSSGADHS